MRKLILSINTTLDGFVATPDGDISWIRPEGEENWNALFGMLEGVDLLVLGRGMWDGYRNYWDSALTGEGFAPNEVKYAQWAKKTKHIVFSSSLKESGWENADIEPGDLKEAISRIKAQEGKDIQIVGGAAFARSLIDTGLVDEYQLLVNPVILGAGKSLFSDLHHRRDLEPIGSRTFENGTTGLFYRQANQNTDVKEGWQSA